RGGADRQKETTLLRSAGQAGGAGGGAVGGAKCAAATRGWAGDPVDRRREVRLPTRGIAGRRLRAPTRGYRAVTDGGTSGPVVHSGTGHGRSGRLPFRGARAH